jgi:hypothetical protein
MYGPSKYCWMSRNRFRKAESTTREFFLLVVTASQYQVQYHFVYKLDMAVFKEKMYQAQATIVGVGHSNLSSHHLLLPLWALMPNSHKAVAKPHPSIDCQIPTARVLEPQPWNLVLPIFNLPLYLPSHFDEAEGNICQHQQCLSMSKPSAQK